MQKNEYLENIFKKTSNKESNDLDRELRKIKSEDLLKNYTAFVIMTIGYFITSFAVLSTGNFPYLTNLYWLSVAYTIFSIILSIFVYIFKKNKCLTRIAGYILFIFFYIILQYVGYADTLLVYNTVRTIKFIYMNYLTSSSCLVFFFKSHLIVIIMISLSNLMLSIMAQVYALNFSFATTPTFVVEIYWGIITPCACVFVNYQYNAMIELIARKSMKNRQ